MVLDFKMPFSIRWVFGGVVGAALAAGCGSASVSRITLQEKLLPRLNPTIYEVDAPISEVKAAIKKAYGDEWFLAEAKKNRERAWKGDGDVDVRRHINMVLRLPPGSMFFKGDADALTKKGSEPGQSRL